MQHFLDTLKVCSGEPSGAVTKNFLSNILDLVVRWNWLLVRDNVKRLPFETFGTLKNHGEHDE